MFKLFAFLGRYGKQPLSSLLDLSLREAQMLAEAVGQLIDEERQATEEASKRPRRR